MVVHHIVLVTQIVISDICFPVVRRVEINSPFEGMSGGVRSIKMRYEG